MSIVDQIREQMGRVDGIRGEELEPLAMAYSAEVAQINQRLIDCSLLLRKGLRSEAIQQAYMRPNLLEWAARLDFPELEEWNEVLMFFELPVPKSLNRAVVQQLQEAIVEEQPLTELLRQHRRLAIAKAPLAWRLKVLRSIAKVDSLNPVWSDDIESWEKVRLAEIPRELQAAQTEHNFQYCKYLSDELKKNTWLLSPPQALITAVQTATEDLENEGQCAELRQIGQALYDSFCSQDEFSGRQHRDQWNSINQLMKRPAPQELSDLVEPALLWLEDSDARMLELEKHRQALVDLEQLLVPPNSIIDIENAYQIAAHSGLEIPPVLEKRVASVIAELRLVHRRKAQLRAASVACMAVVLLVSFAIWQWQNMRTSEIARSVASIRQMLAEDRLQESKQFLDRIVVQQPYVSQAAEMQALASELDGRLIAEKQRLDRFEELVSGMESISPEAIELGLLNEAETLARSQSEKSRTFMLRRSQQEADRRLEAKQLDSVRKSIVRLESTVNSLENQPIESLSFQSFDKVLEELDLLKREHPRSGQTGRDLVENLQRRATNLQRSVRDSLLAEQRLAEGFKRLQNSITLQGYQQALQYFVSNPTDFSNKHEFAEALDERAMWVAVEKWNLLCDRAEKFQSDRTVEVAKELWKSLTLIETEFDPKSILSRLDAVKSYLDRFQRRPEHLEQLISRLRSSLFSSLYTVEAVESSQNNRLRYFAYARNVEKDPVYAKPGTLATIEVLSEANGAVRKITVRPPIVVSKQPKLLLDQLVHRISLQSETMVSNWDKEVLNLINLVLQKQELDSLVSEQTVLMLVETGIDGSHYLNSGLRTTYLELKERQLLSRWVEPTTPRYAIEQDFLSRIKRSFSDSFRGLSRANDEIQNLARSSLRWVGFIYRDNKGQIVPWINQQKLENGNLIVLTAHPTRPKFVELTAVAEVRESEVRSLSGPLIHLAGRPLFFVSKL